MKPKKATVKKKAQEWDSRLMSQEKMLIFLHRLQGRLCAYAHPYKVGGTSFCDCKYDKDNGENIGKFGEAGNGCPEVRQLIHMILAMTPSEFNRVQQRLFT